MHFFDFLKNIPVLEEKKLKPHYANEIKAHFFDK